MFPNIVVREVNPSNLDCDFTLVRTSNILLDSSNLDCDFTLVRTSNILLDSD